MKRRYRVTFSVEIDIPSPFIDAHGNPDEQLLLKQAAYRLYNAVGKRFTQHYAATYEQVEPKNLLAPN